MRIEISEVGYGSRRRRRRLMRQIWTRRFNQPPEPSATGGGAAPAATPPAPTPTPTPTPAPSTPAPTPAPSSIAGSGTSGLPTPGASPASATSVPDPNAIFEQEFAKRFGVDPNQARTLLTLGYQAYQRAGQAPAPAPTPAPAQEPKKNVFGLPEFDHRLLQFVVKGPNGLEALPGAPPDAILQVQRFQDEFQRAQREFYTDPLKFLGPLIDERVEQRAAKLYEERFKEYQGQTTAQKIIQENSSWLFEHDANGQPVSRFNPATGRDEKVPTAWGQYYGQCLQQVIANGVSDPNSQHQLALAMTENAAMRNRLQQQQAPAAGAAAAQQFLNGVARPAQPQTPVVPPAPTPAPAAPTGSRSLREMMSMAFDANGITDEAIRRQTAGLAG